MAAALQGRPEGPRVLTSFIGGLGGRDIGAEEFYAIAAATAEAAASGEVPPPRLLYTQGELREIRKLQAVAQVEAPEVVSER